MDTATPVRAGVDIGGTFTDVVLTTAGRRTVVRKLLSTPDDYSRAVVDGLSAAMADLGGGLDSIGEVVHATTVATNAILQGAGARCALITTAGFRDVLEIGRLRIPSLYDLFYDKRRPLVPRRHVFEVRERIGAKGDVQLPLDPDSLDAAIDGVLASGAEAVAVCLFNGYANPAHERAVAEALRTRAPDLEVSVATEILPQIGEFERTSTTVIDAYVKPIVRSYLEGLDGRLKKNGVVSPVFIMQCSGGLSPLAFAARHPVTMVESGPAAGVLAARDSVAAMGLNRAVSFDMGGTTAKASLIEGGTVTRTRDYEVGGGISATSRLVGGGGYPVNVPVIDVAEVGAGGGSIVWIDSGGSLRVGPRSAGANPGPASYGQGGSEPTVTDANVLLGYLNPDAIAGGALPIHRDLAERAVAEAISGPLGLDLIEAAHGIHLIANSEMIGAIRAVTTQRGRDLREFPLVAFGGSGPIHAMTLALEAGMKTVIVPPSPGLFSAIGLLTTDLSFQRGRMFYRDLGALTPDALDDALMALRDAVSGMAARHADSSGDLTFEVEADLHYWGQSHDLTVALPFGRWSEADTRKLAEDFEAEHERTYGHRADGERIILVGLRVTGRIATPQARGVAPLAESPGRAGGARGDRRAYFGRALGFAAAPVIDRADLGSEPCDGPLLVEEYDTVTVVPPGCAARLDDRHNIVVMVDGGDQR